MRPQRRRQSAIKAIAVKNAAGNITAESLRGVPNCSRLVSIAPRSPADTLILGSDKSAVNVQRLSSQTLAPPGCSFLVLILALWLGKADTPLHALTPANPDDLAQALAYALCCSGKKRKHDAGQIMAAIVASRLVEHLDPAGFVVMKRKPVLGGAALGRGAKDG